jgi:uncharacterized membrane protein required for colicin V production
VTTFDLYFLGILLAFTLGGYLSGFIHKLFGLVGLIAAIWAGMRLGGPIEQFFADWLEDGMIRSLVASAFAGVVVYALFIVLGDMLAKAVKASVIAPVDRMLGLLLGAAQAFVVIGAVVLVGQQLKLDQREWWRKALFKQSGEQAAHLLDRVVDFKSLSDRWLDVEMRQWIGEVRGEAGGTLGEMTQLPRSGTE